MTQTANDKSFKICLVSISLAKGGAERSCAMLSQMLTQKGHEVHLVVLNNEIDYEYEGTLFNLGLLKKGSDNIFKRFNRFAKLRTYIKNNSFDVIIDHRPKNNYKRELFYHNYIYKNCKCIYVIHSSKKKEYFTTQPNSFVKIYNKNSATVSVSDYIKNEIAEKAGVLNCSTIHNGYDPEWNVDVSKISSEIKDKEYILFYGRIDDDVKDINFLMKAFSHAEVWKKNIYLVILGGGKDKKKLQQDAKNLPCFNYIIFLPFTPNPFPYIYHAKFVALTSFYEGFPMVLIESFSLGTPVISLDIISGPSEIIKDKENGLLISKREVPLFAEGLKNMIENEDLYQFCKKNTKPSVTYFSMKNISDKWNNILQNELR